MFKAALLARYCISSGRSGPGGLCLLRIPAREPAPLLTLTFRVGYDQQLSQIDVIPKEIRTDASSGHGFLQQRRERLHNCCSADAIDLETDTQLLSERCAIWKTTCCRVVDKGVKSALEKVDLAKMALQRSDTGTIYLPCFSSTVCTAALIESLSVTSN